MYRLYETQCFLFSLCPQLVQFSNAQLIAVHLQRAQPRTYRPPGVNCPKRDFAPEHNAAARRSLHFYPYAPFPPSCLPALSLALCLSMFFCGPPPLRESYRGNNIEGFRAREAAAAGRALFFPEAWTGLRSVFSPSHVSLSRLLFERPRALMCAYVLCISLFRAFLYPCCCCCC